MNKKNGFTLIELVVSVVLVSIILVTLVGSLLQIRKAYTVVHENSDVIVYTSSISRVINSDINDNNGIRFISCELDGKKCSIILGNDTRREITISDNEKIINDTTSNIEHTNNRTTLNYYDTTKYDKTSNVNDKQLLYIRTLELDKYYNNDSHVTTSNGYIFYDMSATQYEYFKEGNENNIDAFTTLRIRLLDGINLDISQFDITLYGAGRYDYTNYVGKTYTIDLDNNGADIAGTTSIDEVFGIGFFRAESSHKKTDQITKIDIPEKENSAFLGYYYQPFGVTIEKKVIDSGGNIVANPRTFKNNVILNNERTGRVYAKWGECADGFELIDGRCGQRGYTVTLNQNKSGKTCNNVGTTSYTVNFMDLVPSVIVPQCAGYTFEGYLDSANKMYHNRNGNGIEYYDKSEDSTLNANWHACAAGEFSTLTSNSCTSCAKGSYSNASASAICTPCQNGTTTSGTKSTSCNATCTNSNSYVLSWAEATWNENNTLTNNCKIESCLVGYDGQLSSNRCVRNNYKISFTMNGGNLDNSSNPSQMTVSYDEVVTINNPSKAGYEFTGWTLTNGDNTTSYYGSSTPNTLWSNHSTPTKNTKFKNLTPTNGATVTLTANWTICAQGTYSNGVGTTCNICPAGTFNRGTGNTSCTECAKGSYNNTQGSNSCTACQNGITTNGTGKTSCNVSCPHTSNVSSWATASWNTNNTVTNECKIAACVSGYDLDNNCAGNSYNIYYDTNGGNLGYYHPNTVNYDESFTVDNPKRAGYAFDGWTFDGDTTTAYHGSTRWASNSYKTKDTTFKNLTSESDGTVTLTAHWTGCGPGTYNNGDYTYCISCSTGYYSAGAANTSCSICLDGYYCSGGTMTGCPKGTEGNGEGQTSEYYGCSSCNAGYYSDTTGSASCTKCPNGYTSEVGSDSVDDCYIEVSAGHYLSATPNTITECPNGYYKESHRVYLPNTSSCTQCPSGYRDGNLLTYKTSQNRCLNDVAANYYVKTSGSQEIACPTGKEHAAHEVLYGSVSTDCTPKQYNITYYLMGGSDPMNYTGMPDKYTYGIGATINTLTSQYKPVRTGYTFNGFSPNNGSTTDAFFNKTIGISETGHKVYYALWCQNCIQPANGSCSLNASTAGTCTYTTSCNSGYTISGNGTYNPSCVSDTWDCELRGSYKRSVNGGWTGCTAHSDQTHYQAYKHYCCKSSVIKNCTTSGDYTTCEVTDKSQCAVYTNTTSDGSYSGLQVNSSLVGANYACPSGPPPSWKIINDSSW